MRCDKTLSSDEIEDEILFVRTGDPERLSVFKGRPNWVDVRLS